MSIKALTIYFSMIFVLLQPQASVQAADYDINRSGDFDTDSKGWDEYERLVKHLQQATPILSSSRESDFEEAHYLALKLSEYGHKGSMTYLAGFYSKFKFGTGLSLEDQEVVNTDFVIALMWANLAATKSRDHPHYSPSYSNKYIIEYVTRRMSRNEIQEANKLTRDCKRKKYKNCG
jgi:hypothetical protein